MAIKDDDTAAQAGKTFLCARSMGIVRKKLVGASFYNETMSDQQVVDEVGFSFVQMVLIDALIEMREGES